MLKNPQASILISSYNKGNYLEQCIKSCLSQSHKNIEVILLDNHSNDKTNVVLKKYSKKIKILKKKRISKFPALNQIDLLIKAFNNDEDIHNVTAMEVFQVDKDKLTNDLRRKAKTINFGIIYGISPYGLATQLDISNSEAKDYINNYFDKYPGIKEYMENTIEHCRLNGFVVTPFGRRIYIPFINDKVVTRRNFAERSAINAPIQGGAADLIKIVMPKVSDLIKKQKLKSKMLIQVHDELIFEVPKDEVNLIQKEFPEIMIGASENFLKLDVPVKVDIGIGKSWDDAN